MVTKARRELAAHRKGSFETTQEWVDLGVRDDYPHTLDGAVTVVRQLASEQAKEYGIDPDTATDVFERLYRGAADAFGSLSDPREFVGIGLKRVEHVRAIASIKSQNGMPTQNTFVEERLIRQMSAYARGVAATYDLDPEKAAYAAGRFVRDVVLPEFRGMQDNVFRQTPSGSL